MPNSMHYLGYASLGYATLGYVLYMDADVVVNMLTSILVGKTVLKRGL
jgi:hypothetical protein